MKRTLTALVLGVSLLVASGGGVSAADYIKGLEAYQKGDYATALREIRPLAEQGNADPQTIIGVMYFTGQGVTQDYKEAVKWYRKAAEQGVAVAQASLGLMYAYDGFGVLGDNVYAYMWLDIAASSGDADAKKHRDDVRKEMTIEQIVEARKLARECVKKNYKGCGGNGYTQDVRKGLEAYNKGDYATALRELRPLAEQGDAVAQYNLGVVYERGHGVTQDYKEAVKWYRKAAEQGVAEAQFNFGSMYANGQGITQDYKEAVKWILKSAEQGDAMAQSNLGVMYLKGQGVLLDVVYAHMWFNIAASIGDAVAMKNRDIVANNMTEADLSKAQELARECVKKKYKGC